ncbi:MAG: NADPH-dependent F420 reductase [Armatimonadota bacterium]|nr:NADPH-dependent F420 reductase [Armatimonadota bacterium]MDW8156307.1 NADPH-dependent F420 reductase [Armatimonadota bacterium]
MADVGVVGGTGREGFALGVRWAAAGLSVFLGSRVRERGQEAARRAAALDLPGAVSGGTNREAAGAEVVVLAVPFHAHEEVLPDVAPLVRGKVVVDTTVSLVSVDPPQLSLPPEGSAAQRVQAMLPGARVVAAFHTVSAHKLAQLGRELEEDTLLCGDDPTAKARVAQLAQALGLRPVDAGGLDQASTLERLAALVVGLNRRYRRKAVGVRFVGL